MTCSRPSSAATHPRFVGTACAWALSVLLLVSCIQDSDGVSDASSDSPRPVCRGLDEAGCLAASPMCAPLNASWLGEEGEARGGFAGCATVPRASDWDASGLVCGTASGCAHPPDSEKCYSFSMLCFPDGWVEMRDCRAPDCPLRHTPNVEGRER